MPPVASPSSRRASQRDLRTFLTDHGVEVLEVSSGVSPETRRLVVGRRGTPQPAYVIAVANSDRAVPAIDREARQLKALRARLRRPMQRTVPRPVERLEAGGRPALAATAVPGLPTSSGRSLAPATGRESQAVLTWLEMLWQDTIGPGAPVDLGRDAADRLVTYCAGVSGVGETLEAVHRARARLGAFLIPRTMSHGCLCRGHVLVRDGLVSGVDDWGGSRVEADPLRDLGGWLVRAAGPRLGEVVAARTPHNRALRDFVVGGLRVWGIPASCWRDVVLLCRAEIADEGLRTGDFSAMDSLARASRALSRERGRHGSGT